MSTEDVKARFETALGQLAQPGSPFELGDASYGGVNYRVYKNAPTSLRELLAPGRAHGDNTFLVFEGERWSFNDFFRQADAIGHQLVHNYGVKKGDRIAIAMRNYPEWMTAFVAITSIGAIAVPLNSWGQAQELEYGFRDAGARIVFCDQQRLAQIAPSLQELKVRAIVARAVDVARSEWVETLESMIAGAEGQPMPESDSCGEDPVLIMYTSGTTGNPKGAVSSHRNLAQAVVNFECTGYAYAMSSPEAIGHMMSLGHPPAALLCLPLFHVSGCHSIFLLSLRAGRKIVMMYKWDIKKALELIEQERVTTLSAVPSMAYELLLSEEFDKHDTSSLSGYGCGGTACPTHLPGLIYQKAPKSFPGTGYGMTETNGTTASSSGDLFKHKPHSTGIIAPIVEVDIRDDAGRSLPLNTSGEIFVKSPTVVQGYWNKPEATTESFVDGWLRTGDIGYVDDEGYVFIVDRAKDMIIRGGENIYSAEIETALQQHPGVHEVAAFGVPHEVLGEELCVAIIPMKGHTLTEQEIADFMRARVAHYKVPAHIEIRSEPFPRNATGKVLKKALRDALATRIGRIA